MDTISPLAYRIPDACRLLGVGRSTIYDLFGLGELTPVKIGRITLVDADELRALLKRRLEEAKVSMPKVEKKDPKKRRRSIRNTMKIDNADHEAECGIGGE